MGRGGHRLESGDVENGAGVPSRVWIDWRAGEGGHSLPMLAPGSSGEERGSLRSWLELRKGVGCPLLNELPIRAIAGQAAFGHSLPLFQAGLPQGLPPSRKQVWWRLCSPVPSPFQPVGSL